MKYTIELSNKQKAQMDCMMDIVHRYVGFNPKLEPITSDVAGYMTSEEIKAIKEKAKQEGYDTGYKQGVSDSKVKIEQAYKDGYNIGLHDGSKFEGEEYNRGLEDVDHAIEVVKEMTGEECAEWFDDCVGLDAVICGFSIPRIIEITKAYEEKKKVEEEIKVGDEVKNHAIGNIGVVLSIGKKIIAYVNNNGVYTGTKGSLEKTGRHFKEIEQLLDKLRGEEWLS